MVYMTFPPTLSEEEQMLQSKYQKLKKKKKALHLLKAPKPEPEKPTVPKRPAAGKDAKEVAKKLLQSGAISAIKIEKKEKQGFKRSKILERKLSSTEKPGSAVSGYQPFSQSHQNEEENHDTQTESVASFRPPMKGLYESFVSARESENRDKERLQERDRDGKTERPRQGNTVYIHGYGVTEEILRTGFASFGNIINISMEIDKNCGFITFEKMESAEKAISEMNGSMVMGIQLKVSLARRQPVIEPGTENSSSSWSTIATNNSQKGCHKDKRELVQYDDDLFS